VSHASASADEFTVLATYPKWIGVMKNRPFLEWLSFAMFGLSMAWRRERGFRTQVMIEIAATAFTAVLAPSLIWVAAVALGLGGAGWQMVES
jgi:hypothetical protein